MAQRREGNFEWENSEIERKFEAGVWMRLSHEVTVGDSHGREPVKQHSTVVFSPEGTTGNNAK